jgi:hypothetical protein
MFTQSQQLIATQCNKKLQIKTDGWKTMGIAVTLTEKK